MVAWKGRDSSVDADLFFFPPLSLSITGVVVGEFSFSRRWSGGGGGRSVLVERL